jgi:hypothetical protein
MRLKPNKTGQSVSLPQKNRHKDFDRSRDNGFDLSIRVNEIDIRLDQENLRSNPVNTEEGTPMGVGVWYAEITPKARSQKRSLGQAKGRSSLAPMSHSLVCFEAKLERPVAQPQVNAKRRASAVSATEAEPMGKRSMIHPLTWEKTIRAEARLQR